MMKAGQSITWRFAKFDILAITKVGPSQFTFSNIRTSNFNAKIALEETITLVQELIRATIKANFVASHKENFGWRKSRS